MRNSGTKGLISFGKESLNQITKNPSLFLFIFLFRNCYIRIFFRHVGSNIPSFAPSIW